MPTQEEINAANVELQIANDNYAALANRYNKYKQVFEAYASASPEVQERARWAMQAALEDYNKLRDNMLAAENRIAMAQNAVNNINSIIAQSQISTWGQRRRTVTQPQQYMTPMTDMVGWMSTVNWPQQGYITQPQPKQYMTPMTDMVGWMSTANWIAVWTPAPRDTTPLEIRRVRGLKWNDYLQWMKDLEKYWGYRVVDQKAYKNWNKYSLN